MTTTPSACTSALTWPELSMVTEWPFTRIVPSTRPAIVSGSSAVTSPVMVIEGPMTERVEGLTGEVGCIEAPLRNAPDLANVVPGAASLKSPDSGGNGVAWQPVDHDIVFNRQNSSVDHL